MILAWKLICMSMRSGLQYPASFIMLTLSYFLSTCIDILGVWILFDRFHMIKGWTLYEVGMIYGIVQIGFALAETFARGFDTFNLLIKYGEFDLILLRPTSSLLQIATRDIQLMRLGRLIQGLIILIWSIKNLDLPFHSLHLFTIIFSILGTTCLFYGLFVIQAAFSFWTIEGLEMMNITTYGGLQAGQYPMSIYHRFFRLLFTLLIPLACVGYYPIATLLKHESLSPQIAILLPCIGCIFLYLACQFWHFAIKHYQSTGN